MERAVHVGSLVLLVIALFLAGWTLFFPEQADSVPPTPVPTALPLNTVESPLPLPSVDPLPNDPLVPDVVHPKSGRYVAAWMPTDWDTDNARASFEANLDYIDEISPVWYDMRSNGTLSVLGGARDQTLVDAVKRNNGAYSLNIPHPDRIATKRTQGTEVLNPAHPADKDALLQALARSTEIVTSLPSVSFYTTGTDSVASLIAHGLKNSTSPATIIYTAENNNHAAEIL